MLVFAGTGRNRVVVARVLCHCCADVRMRGEERFEFRMFLKIRIAVDQRRLVGELTRDIRMLGRKVTPSLELGKVDVAGVGGSEFDDRVAVHNRTERRAWRDRQGRSGKSYWKCESGDESW